MKNFLSLFVVAVLAAGCSSAPTVTNTTTNTSVSINNNPTNANVETAASNSEKPPSIAFGTEENAKGSGRFPNPNANGGIDVKNVKVITPTRPASDNSQVASTMDKEGTPIETRTFKSHPILLKTERIYTDIQNPNGRVYLKNGKIVELPPDPSINLSIAPANEILKAIGNASNVAPQKDGSTKKAD